MRSLARSTLVLQFLPRAHPRRLLAIGD